MLLAVLFDAAVGLARVRVWSISSSDSHRFTVAMLGFAGAGLLFKPSIGDQRVDPTLDFMGANTSDLVQHLLVVFACYQLVTSLTSDDWSERQLRLWRGLALIVGAAMIGTYALSDQTRIPATEFELTDPGSVAHQWLLLAWLVAASAVTMQTAIANITKPGVDLRNSSMLTLLFGIAGGATGLVTAVLLITDAPFAHTHYSQIATVGATFTLVALGAAGIPGLVATWHRRDDPRP